MRTPKGSNGLRLSVETVIDDRRWDRLEFGEVCRSACNAALSAAGIEPGSYEIGVLGCCDERIADLNRRFRNTEGPTNVLAWPAGPDPAAGTGPTELGNIAVAFETCMEEAGTLNRGPDSHLAHLIAHACLHLAGFGHETEEEAKVMEGLEALSLARLGIDDPHST